MNRFSICQRLWSCLFKQHQNKTVRPIEKSVRPIGKPVSPIGKPIAQLDAGKRFFLISSKLEVENLVSKYQKLTSDIGNLT